MGTVPWTCDVNSPDDITPGTVADVECWFQNNSPEHSYYIDSIRLTPTWDDSTSLGVTLGSEIEPRTRRRFKLKRDRIDIPAAIGRKASLLLQVEGTYRDESGPPGSFAAIRSLDVTDPEPHHALVYGSKETDVGAQVHQLLKHWGLRRETIDEYNEAKAAFESGPQPACVVGTLSEAGDTTQRGALIGRLVDLAMEYGAYPFVFTAPELELGDAVDAEPVCQVTVDPANPAHVKRAAAPSLLAARDSKTEGRVGRLLSRASTDDGRSLRDWLELYAEAKIIGLGETVALSGGALALKRAGETIPIDDGNPLQGLLPMGTTVASGAWPMRGADPQHTGYHPADRGTVDSVTTHWSHETRGWVSSSPAVADGTVYVGSVDHHVYALDARTGRKRWPYETGGWVKSSPAVADGTVYVGSRDNHVYALAEDN